MPSSLFTSSACSRVFATPELVESISHSLDFKTITIAARVSRSWNNLWLPIIWYTINNGRQWQREDFTQALSRHSDLIRVLQCSRYDDISCLISDPDSNHHCRNLVTLVVPETTLENQADQAKIIRQNPGLLELSLAFHGHPSSTYIDLIQAVSGLGFLRQLAFDDNQSLQVETLETIMQGCHSLEELSLKGVYFFLKHPFGTGDAFASKWLATSKITEQAESEYISHDVPEQEKKAFLGIKSLCMDNVACSQDLILNLASRFPNLERFSLKLSSEICFSKDFASRLAQRSPHIKWLDISETDDMDDSTMAALIRNFPRLQTLKAAETRFSELSLCALIECCPDLEELDIRETYGLESESIQRLLEKCQSLKSLNAWDTSVNVPKMIMEAYRSQSTTEEGHSVPLSTSTLSSEIVITDLWACRNLESLTLNFCYDQPSLTEQEQRLIPPAAARRYLLEQLSRLTNLRNLSIRTSYYCSDDGDSFTTEERKDSDIMIQRIQKDMSLLVVNNLSSANVLVDRNDEEEEEKEYVDYDALFNIAYTLPSGLAMLSPLKQLRSLFLTAVPHAIGLDDIQWMCQHWPKLNRIEGLYWDEDWDEDKLVLSWLQENKPKIAIVE